MQNIGLLVLVALMLGLFRAEASPIGSQQSNSSVNSTTSLNSRGTLELAGYIDVPTGPMLEEFKKSKTVTTFISDKYLHVMARPFENGEYSSQKNLIELETELLRGFEGANIEKIYTPEKFMQAPGAQVFVSNQKLDHRKTIVFSTVAEGFPVTMIPPMLVQTPSTQSERNRPNTLKLSLGRIYSGESIALRMQRRDFC
ncbi:hypothetical protein GYMLUDRAFT_56521 [Collybiopsis luxurians FD-317 M1]|nr:hypothetical protein GYMLUDRAFT_56521 [Collybiopsis luxurians FD-317 M1]